MAVSAPSPAAAASASSTRREPAGRRFEDALRRAEGEAGPSTAARRGGERHATRPLARAPGERPEGTSPGGAWAARDAARLCSTSPPGIPELQAAVRAAPPAIAAAVAGGGPAQLALTFGSALCVDLRTGAQGLELSLRPAPSLERAARAELPRLVEALRARGLRVARAEVRDAAGVGAAQPPSRAR